MIHVCQSRLLRRVLFAIIAAGVGPLIAAAQSELVIHREGTQQYHRPGCDVIRDAKDMTSIIRDTAKAPSSKETKPDAPDDNDD